MPCAFSPAMAFWARQARRAIFPSGKQRSHVVLEPEECRQQFCRNKTEILELGTTRREALGFCKNLVFFTHGRESGRNGVLFLGLGRELRWFASESKEDLDPKASSSAEDLNLRPQQPDGLHQRAKKTWIQSLLQTILICIREPRRLGRELRWFASERKEDLDPKSSSKSAEDPNLRPQPDAQSHSEKWRIFMEKGRDLYRQRSFDNAENFYYKALEEAKLGGFGEEDRRVTQSYYYLGMLFEKKKQYDKAEPFYLKVVNWLRQRSGEYEKFFESMLDELGWIYRRLGKTEQARRCYEENLQIKGRKLGLDHPGIVRTMYQLAEVMLLQGYVNDGLALIRYSIRILEQAGLRNTSLAVRLSTMLLQLLVFSGHRRKFLPLRRKVLQLFEFSQDFLPKDNAALASYDKAKGLLLEAVKMAELHHKEGSARQRKSSAQGNAVATPVLLAHCLATLGLDIGTDKELSWEICTHTEMVLRCAISYLEDILVQQGDKESSKVRKLYKECSRNLADLNKIKLKLKSP